MNPIEKAIAIAVRDCLAVKKHETVLVRLDIAQHQNHRSLLGRREG